MRNREAIVLNREAIKKLKRFFKFSKSRSDFFKSNRAAIYKPFGTAIASDFGNFKLFSDFIFAKSFIDA